MRRGGSILLRLGRIFVVMGGACLLGFNFATNEQTNHRMNQAVRSSSSFHLQSQQQPNPQGAAAAAAAAGSDSPDLFPHPTAAIATADNDSPWPRICWLASFPNSGTSYTAQLIKHITFTRSASNYGEDNLDENDESVPVYPGDWNGPFYVDPVSLNKQGYDNPPKYVLTKTHCGGYRQDSSPDLYVESTHSFRRRCFETKYIRNVNSTSGTVTSSREKGKYDTSKVHKTIHLIRNPYDNIVSRFHLEAKRTKSLNKSRSGFREFCKNMDERWKESERSSIVFDDSILDLMERVPCHSDFFRYVEWHNMAFITTQDLGIDTMVLHYEDYGTRFNATVNDILNFLELEPKGSPRPFIEGKQYTMEYYTSAERDAAKQVLEWLSLRVTWANIAHYFP